MAKLNRKIPQLREQDLKRLRAVSEKAKECLKDKKFAKYKSEYEEAEEFIIKKLLKYHNPDPVKYAFAMQDILENLKHCRSLLGKVERDVSKKATKGKDE